MTKNLNLLGAIAPPLHLRKFSVEQYRRLGELGVLTPEDNVELLEGWIVEKMNQRPVHGYLVRLLNDFWLRELPAGWICQCQLPISAPRSEPEPDVAVLKGQHSDFREHHPRGSDCALVIEVADTSLEKDRAKAEIYSTAGVQEYWIVNVAEACVEQYRFDGTAAVVVPQVWNVEHTLTFEVGGKVIRLDLKVLFE